MIQATNPKEKKLKSSNSKSNLSNKGNYVLNSR